jgi:hypothetical protein
MRIGVTGTTKGAMPQQLAELSKLLHSFSFTELHHGDAIGVDAQAHSIVSEIRDDGDYRVPRITIHPPDNDVKRAFCEGADEVWLPKPYLKRDTDVASNSDLLIAVPDTREEQLRSGTWATVRRARQLGRLIIRISPGGVIELG